MKRSVIVSALVMLLLPWLAVTFAPGDAGMAICMLLFYGANPLYALWAGWSAGANVRKMWSIPVTTAAFFLIGAWIFLMRGNPYLPRMRWSIFVLALRQWDFLLL